MALQLSLRVLWRTFFSLAFLASINAGKIAKAQVVPDGTLPTIVEQLENMRKITGGERVGDNLFHSFEEFSIPTGMEAIFENAIDIQNIFTRITGSDISIIDGLLKTAGGANFFLINPNGIVFGENAQLDVGGSFIATTANSIEFGDGQTFSARDEKPILTWNAPIGLGLDGNNGSITVNGSGNQINSDSTFSPIEFSERPSGLSAPSGETIALIGNGVNFNGGVVTTEGGKIYITSGQSGSVGINQSENRLTLTDNSANVTYQDINLNQLSLIDASGESVGNISVIGKNINLDNASFILAQNQGSLPGGSINLKASESINLSGNSPDGNIASTILSQTLNSGEGANINLDAHQLVQKDLGSIQTATFSNGTGGNLNIDVANNVELSLGFISAISLAGGNAGNINLSTSQLRLIPLGGVTSSALGEGNGGNITIKANSIEVIGASTTSNDRSTISVSSFSNSQDQPGNAGNLNITTEQLRIEDGGSVSSSSFGTGNAGNLFIDASESIEVSGINDNIAISDNPQSTIRTAVQATSPIGQERFNLPSIPTGDAGSLTIKTPVLNVAQQGTISVENQGTGSAGSLTINANNLNLDQAGTITAAATSGIGGNVELKTSDLNLSNDSQITAAAGGEGNGGNITINTTNLNAKKNNNITASAAQGEGGNVTIDARNSLSLIDRSSIAASSESGQGGDIALTTDKLQTRDNSNISTSARGLGDGGNVTIKADSVLAINDSDITARAEQGNGGNITIEADGVLGIEERPAEPNNGTSDADASSEFGADGTVEISNPISDQYDPIIAMREPNTKAIGEGLRSQCWAEDFDRRSLSLVVVGGGGFPSSPYDFQDEVQYAPDPDFVPPPEEEKEDWVLPPAWQPGDPIINSNAIRITEDGQIYAVAVLTPQKAEELLCGSEEVGEEGAKQ